MIDSHTYWSNCLIDGLAYKCMSPKNIELKFLFFGFHFHVMWYNKQLKAVQHFTHKYLDGWHCDLYFKGQIETMSVQRFNDFCKKKGLDNLVIEDIS